MIAVIVRLALSVLLLWRVWEGDRWALVLVLALGMLYAELMVSGKEKHDSVKGRLW